MRRQGGVKLEECSTLNVVCPNSHGCKFAMRLKDKVQVTSYLLLCKSSPAT